MRKHNRKTFVAVAGVSLTLAVWLGASAYQGRAAEQALRAFAERPAAETGVRVHELRHRAGLLSASGSFGLEIATGCGGAAGEPRPQLQVDYTLDHLALPSAPLRASWRVRPSEALARAFATADGELALHGSGVLTYTGTLETDLSLPGFSFSQGGRQLTVAPSAGHLALGPTALAAHWRVDRAVARGSREFVELGGVRLDLDLSDRRLGTGSTALSVERIATGRGWVDGFRHASQTTEAHGRLHARVTESLRAAAFGGETAKDLALDMAIRDLDTHSVEAIGRLASATCGLQNLGADEGAALRTALRTLLARGFSVEVPQLAGTLGGSDVNGALTLEARQAPSAPVELGSALRASGRLAVAESGLAAGRLQKALALGLRPTADGALSAGFDFIEGVLHANGQAVQGGTLQAGLSGAELALGAFFGAGRPALLAGAAPVAPDGKPAAAPRTAEARPALPAPASASLPKVLALPPVSLAPAAFQGGLGVGAQRGG